MFAQGRGFVGTKMKEVASPQVRTLGNITVRVPETQTVGPNLTLPRPQRSVLEVPEADIQAGTALSLEWHSRDPDSDRGYVQSPNSSKGADEVPRRHGLR